MSRIFISHSSANNAAALALANWLEANGWTDYFLDIDDTRGIAPGERWIAALAGAVDRCEAVIFLLSPAWRDSKYCFTEFFEAKKLGKRIFGVIVETIPLSQLPEQMTAEWQVCDLTDAGNRASFTVARPPSVKETVVSFSSAGLDALAHGLRRAGLDASTFVWPPEGEPNRSPYPGLRAMEEVDAAVFFGREASIVRAIDQIRLVRERDVEQVFIVLGASGAGKSSFLRAGVLPRLRRDSEHFIVLPCIRPQRLAISGSHGLLDSLRGALTAAGQSMSPADVRGALASTGLAGVLRRILPADHPVEPTLIVPVDQAEELFGSDGQEEAQQFLTCLDELREHTGGGRLRVLIVLTIRSDSLPKLQAQSALQAMSPVLFSLPAMPASEFKAVIEGPARRHTQTVKPLIITPQLADQLVVDAQGADALPLLALTLEWLYREFTDAQGTRVGYDEYQRLGGVRGVIGMAVARAFEPSNTEPAIPEHRQEQERLLRQMFPYIATVDPDTGDWKRRVASRDVIRKKLPQCDALVSRLVEQRLLLADSRPAPQGADLVEVIEVAHEALLRQWDTLERWLREFAAALSASESIRRAAIDWQRSGKDEALLVHTAHRLDAAEALLSDERLEGRFESLDAAYLAACRQRDRRELQEREEQLQQIAEQQAARAKLQRKVTWGLSTAFLIVLVMTISIVRQAREVNRQASLVLLGAANAASEQKLFDQSIRLSVLASRPSWLGPDSADAFGEAFRAAKASTLHTLFRYGKSPIVAASFSPDGTRVVTGSDDGTARLWDADSGEPVTETLRHGGRIRAVSFSPDGTRLVTASTDNTARIWDINTGKAVGELMHGGLAYAMYSAGFSFDGKHVLTVSGEARVWNAGTAKPVTEPIGSGIHSASFNRDGKLVLTASDDEARLWDVDTGKPVGEPMRHDESGVSATFSPEGKRVVSISRDNAARLWDADTGKALGPPMRHAPPAAPTREIVLDYRIVSASFSPDGKLIVTAGVDNTARIWDAVTGKPVGNPITHSDRVVVAGFSPDSKLVVTGSQDKSARLWHADTGDPIGEPMIHEAAVTSVSFSSDGKRVLTTSEDGTARVWDARDNEPADEPPKLGQHLVSSIFSSSGRRVVTMSQETNRLRHTLSWKAFRSWMSGQLWVEELCQTKLRGNIAIVTEADVRAARILSADRAGENLCDGVWTGPGK